MPTDIIICEDCGRKFKSVTSAKVAFERGCPHCGSFNIEEYEHCFPKDSEKEKKENNDAEM